MAERPTLGTQHVLVAGDRRDARLHHARYPFVDRSRHRRFYRLPRGGDFLTKRESVSKETGLRTIETEYDFGRGRVTVVQVMSEKLSIEARKMARKQILIPGFRPSIREKTELSDLKKEMTILSLANQSEGGRAEQLVTVGIAFTGRRKNSMGLVDGFQQGVDITRIQFEKAQDFVAATNTMIEGNNAEVVGYSLGGSTALIAVALGLRVDMVGLLNSAGLFRRSKDRSRILRRRVFHDEIDKEMKVSDKGHERSLWDRIKRLRAEYWSAYRLIAHPLMNNFPNIRFVVGNSEDRIYPRKRVRKILREGGAQNITFVDLPWKGHVLGRKKVERLGEFARVMHAARRAVL